MNRLSALSAAALLAVAAPLFAANGKTAAPPKPAPAEAPAVPTDTVTLAYKYPPGRVQRFVATATMQYSTSSEGSVLPIPMFPVSMQMRCGATEKVLAVRGGDTGILVLRTDEMSISTGAMGQQVTVGWRNGKINASVGGVEARKTNEFLASSAAMSMLKNKLIVVERGPLGEITSSDAGGGPQMYGLGTTAIQFPDHPVKIGESWEVSQRYRPTPAAGETEPQAVEIRARHTLKSIEWDRGHRCAVIETAAGGANLPPDDSTTPSSFIQRIRGKTRVDIDRGAIVSGEYTLDLSMKMLFPQVPTVQSAAAMPIAHTAPSVQTAFRALRMDGTVAVSLREVEPGASAPAKPTEHRRSYGSYRYHRYYHYYGRHR